MLNVLGSKCGFGTNYYQFNQAVMATATQVISTNSKMAETRGKHQIILEQALVELCRILLRLGNTAMNAGLDEDIAISTWTVWRAPTAGTGGFHGLRA